MSGQVWYEDTQGGFLYSDQLSNYLRMALQDVHRFRQFCEIKDAIGYGKGDRFNWNIFSKIKDPGGTLKETQPIPQSSFSITQGSLIINEYGNSIPYTKKLDDLSKQPVQEIIKKVLKNDATDTLELAAYEEWASTRLLVVPTGGTSPDSVTFEVGTTAVVNDVALGKEHVKLISDEMKERNIPPYEGDSYFALARTRTFRPLKNELEDIHKYVETGAQMIYRGEIGRYEGIRFTEHTSVASKNWTNGKSDEAFFFGNDTVAEGIVEAPQIRGKIPGDFGRDKGIAWYAMQGFGIVHNDPSDNLALQNRIIKWTSAS